MKPILVLSLAAALLGGCAIVPAGYGDHRDGYYGDRGYYRGDGRYRGGDFNGRDGNYRDYNYRDYNYRDYNYRGGQGSPANPFRDHGG